MAAPVGPSPLRTPRRPPPSRVTSLSGRGGDGGSGRPNRRTAPSGGGGSGDGNGKAAAPAADRTTAATARCERRMTGPSGDCRNCTLIAARGDAPAPGVVTRPVRRLYFYLSVAVMIGRPAYSRSLPGGDGPGNLRAGVRPPPV